MRLPPKWVRRVILAPLVIVVALLLVVTIPLWLLGAIGLTSLVPGRFRLPRVLWLVTVYLLWDSALLVVMFALWIASGFGWKLDTPAFRAAHYRIGARGLEILFDVFGSVLRLAIVTSGSDAEETDAATAAFDALFAPGTPLVVASRHAGPGDSFILIHTLLNEVDRRPRIVLKYTMQWDPAIDVLLNRIPTRFIVPSGFGGKTHGGGHSVEESLRDLATDLGPDDAFVIFPEGGNMTSTRRRSRIDRLRDAGRTALADRAEAMTHVMPPQPGGMYAALEASVDADVVFIAHTGLDRLVTMADIWRDLPMDKRITMRAWRVPRAEIPAERDAQAEWLFAWFERIDGWIAAQTPIDEKAGPPPLA
ncbi:1-acyl-sn-glycerol-3-phosphate acyltransferase [Microbacterium sp. 4R-513]|uniref:1-acyl-sn-glycerol-3-phosphate acyltransferase n=1 Tax=Microbacterium sp. 4R-513 TaxID=2567934 RepID=UPI0013E1708D|nr:1-acyl-sn-glycerol-3-phosphate acyltransferase [Microbacterium sp. 4R-513]QIG38910.1 1-acyl-sn-glycerol-3-phosphate acyltransferase [Microbacterium sp. 4R-513]